MNNKLKIVIGSLGVLLFLIIGLITYNNLINKSSLKNSNSQTASAIITNYKIDDSTGDDLESTSITSSGVYHLSGEYSCIYVNTSGDVQLNLDGATISCSSGPGIYVEDADSVTITLTGENSVTATTTEELAGAIYSTDDLVFSGDGSLTVTSNYDGIVSKER